MSSRQTTEQDSFLGEEEPDEELPQNAPFEEAARALQSAILFDLTFDETHEREDSDAEQSTMSLPTAAEKNERDAAAIRQSSKTESVAKVLRFDTNTDRRDSGSGQSPIQHPPDRVGESLVSTDRPVESTKNTELPTTQAKNPLAATGKPLAGITRAAKSTKNTKGVSPQTVLRGLVRGAHREMMYFTLSHERFSLNDLRQGLDYAFCMLQAAQSKLAILTVLHDDMTDVSAVDLRAWLAHIDRLDPQTRYEPRMFVMFESLSSGEIRVTLEEVVQSRLIVEDELKQTKALLVRRLTELERNAKSSVWLAAAGDCIDSLQSESAGTAGGLLGENEAETDAAFMTFMVVAIGAFYLCVR